MANIDLVRKNVMGLLWDGRHVEARALIAAEREKAEEELISLKSMLSALEDMMPGDSIGIFKKNKDADSDSKSGAISNSGNSDCAAESMPRVLTEEEIDKRRKAVINAAHEVARNDGERITADSIVRRLNDQGVDLHVPPTRRTTTIASILGMDDNFKRIGKGLYQINPPQLFKENEL